MQKVNMNKRNSSSYLGSVDTRCVSDMMKVDEIRSMVKTMNKELRLVGAKDKYGALIQYRVSLKGREAIQKGINLRTGNPISYNTWNGDVIGGLKNAGRIDVYIHRRYVY